ncbi:unnamed protein product [[Candida] boidinii]|uniref:Histone chaperone ASF1 n=1 Tax=Candida boidinii TaxID=5477 RepID=A0A9W6T2D3_CANBO|nr:hypothetical protein BVG19_g2368 [[Candida] boidinii]OWB51388.1 hypothetical protein B5S27_g2948 [[Candida] boidinii]OWB65830.1 hypothetical protein B5S30_g1162 [[Candida] boidinii]GME69902.1 unnamed protein product [[Candida] boidinii]GMF97537.1 unnamed protein product [[Candida] boidinii]
MSIVSLLGINVLNNPARFSDAYQFEITFECLEPLKDDLEWKLTYVGSSRSLEHDQELDSILVGPVPVGVNKFILTADAPSPELIPASELVSVTVILLSCSYKDREFVRVGYYVNNEYDSEELRENPPNKVQVDHIVRNILAEKPRVTRFNIVWDNENDNPEDFPPDQREVDIDEEDEDRYADEDDEDEEEIADDEEAEDDEDTKDTTPLKAVTESEPSGKKEESNDADEEDIEEDIGDDDEEEDIDEDIDDEEENEDEEEVEDDEAADDTEDGQDDEEAEEDAEEVVEEETSDITEETNIAETNEEISEDRSNIKKRKLEATAEA